jgi:serine protease AprX
MSRASGSSRGDVRSSALWGKGGRGAEVRTRAATGKSGRGVVAVLSLVVALGIPTAGLAGNGKGDDRREKGAYVAPSLLEGAKRTPDKKIRVIIRAKGGTGVAEQAFNAVGKSGKGNGLGKLKRRLGLVGAIAVELPAARIEKLAENPNLEITPDNPVQSTSYEDAEMWRDSTGANYLQYTLDLNTGEALGPAPQAPAIAIVDSGVDPTKAEDFGARLVESVNLSTLAPDATGDDQGHGTMVAGIAAGAGGSYPGVAQNAPIVSIRTSDANGMSLTSDVIAAADWILANKDRLNIRVANFSVRGSVETSFRFDPLDRAVERLWFSGVTVVAAAGNHGTGNGPVSMSFAPGNDPFIITVGALDEQQSADPIDNDLAWWSGYGTTADGFYKPELAAPGRYMIAPVPASSTLTQQFPDRVVGPGYMWMSGTSFAAPVVSGIAAQILARNPSWTPDQVKGALMRNANFLSAPGFAAGVGEVEGLFAAHDVDPPNPNENLNAFVTADPITGGKTFDEAAWASHVSTSAAWSSAAWASAAWSSAAWSSAAWASAAWSSAAWSSTVDSAMTNAATVNENARAE